LAYDLLAPAQPMTSHGPVVIAIDDASLAELGRWPWPRDRYVALIDKLDQVGAAAIGLDILFSEPDLANPGSDSALVAALARNPKVVLPVAPGQTPGQGLLGPSALHQAGGKPPSLGHVDVEFDLDGQVRRLYLLAGDGQAQTPAFALAMRQVVDPSFSGSKVPGLRSSLPPRADLGIWVRDQEVLLPRLQLSPTLSFAQVMRSPELLTPLRGRAVFIGVTAAGLGAELVTPLLTTQSSLPAVQLHAQVYAALQQNALLQRGTAWAMVLVALALMSSLAWWPQREGRRAWMTGGLVLTPLVLSGLALHWVKFWFAPAAATLAMAVALVCWWAEQFRQVRRQVQQQRQHALATLSAIGDAVITLDSSDLGIRYANPTAEMRSGLGPLRGRALWDALPLTSESQARLNAAMDECRQAERRVELMAPLSLAGGVQGAGHAYRAIVNPLLNPEGQLDGLVLVLSDVTAVLSAARALDYAATHDALTTLPNRLLLQQRLGLALARAQRSGNGAAVLFLDLNRFKRVNDSLGHRVGDQVLRVVAQRLLDICRDTDTVARWGGDEFVVVLEVLRDQRDAAAAAAKIIDALSQELEFNDDMGHLSLSCAVSVGVAMVPQDGDNVDDLLSRAEAAMYRAKAQAQASFHFWSEDLNTRMHARLGLDVDLRHGLRDDQFVLYYQPQICFSSGDLVGMEALMRWQRAPDLLVMPDEFIPVAEDSGLIIDLGAWAVLEACRQIARWRAAGLPPVPLSVNVSARQCLNLDIVQVVRLALQETAIPPALLRLEITESAAMSDAESVIGLLHAIRAMGVGLVLDDFGTGYSSLAYIKHFPIDEIKIDRSFVRSITTDKNDVAIVQATIALAHGLNLRVVAEGVETDAQRQLLSAARCDVAQGYLFGRPQTPQAATQLLRAQGHAAQPQKI
jgi:diguanylate cyclase (GGDEF)-like protein